MILQFYRLYRHNSLGLRPVVFLFTYLFAVFRLLLFADLHVINLILTNFLCFTCAIILLIGFYECDYNSQKTYLHTYSQKVKLAHALLPVPELIPVLGSQPAGDALA